MFTNRSAQRNLVSMARSLMILVGVGLIIIGSGAAAACLDSSPTPILMPITNVELSNGHSMRGLAGSVGTPAQNISFLPHAYLNDTWIYNTSSPFCFDNTPDSQCYTIRGGQYDPADSPSAHRDLDVLSAGGDSSDTTRSSGGTIWSGAWTTDDLSVGNSTLSDFPIGMPGFDHGDIFDTQANIGLGQNSTLLNALKASGRIASRTYSYWWGVNSATSTNALDGHIVFGGYDQAKVVGPNVTRSLLPPSASCPSGMLMTITNMVLGFPNGTKADMLAPSVLSACVQPDYPVVISPRFDPFFERFEALTDTSHNDNAGGSPWSAVAYRLAGSYPGDLTIISDESMQFNIPNDVLILPEEYVAPSGAFETNASAPGILMAPTVTVNVNDVPILGRPFFTAAYLMVDLDAQTWTIWQANATTESQLVSLGGECDRQSSEPTAAARPTMSSDPDSGDSDHGLTAGAVAGVVVGAVGAVLLAVGLWWLYNRRRKLDKTLSGSQQSSSEHSRFPHDYLAPSLEQRTLHEMSASEVYEIEAKHDLPEVPGGGYRETVELPAARQLRIAPSGLA